MSESADHLRTRIAAVQRAHRLNSFGANYVQCECGWKSPEKYATWTDHPEHVADAVIADLPELGRIANVAEVCMASLDLDSRSGTALSDRQWLAETILNVLNGAVDD